MAIQNPIIESTCVLCNRVFTGITIPWDAFLTNKDIGPFDAQIFNCQHCHASVCPKCRKHLKWSWWSGWEKALCPHCGELFGPGDVLVRADRLKTTVNSIPEQPSTFPQSAQETDQEIESISEPIKQVSEVTAMAGVSTRPWRVTFIAVSHFVFAILFLGFFSIFSLWPTLSPGDLSARVTLFVIGLILGLPFALVGYGMWECKLWAYCITYLLGLPLMLVGYYAGAILRRWLRYPEVREAFGLPSDKMQSCLSGFFIGY